MWPSALRVHSAGKTAVLDCAVMGTERLYYQDSYLRDFDARVLKCQPCSPSNHSAAAPSTWQVILDRTAFYPTSGGQPNDLGLLNDANVLDVREEGDDIVHVVDKDLSPCAVRGSVQWPRRFDHMQQHTGQHLLSAMFQQHFALPTVSFHLGSEICTIDLRGPEPAFDVLQTAQRAANEIVFEDRAVNVRYGTADQLAQIGVRKQVDREGVLRAIEIESTDLQPCGGTHVKRTAQIGLVLVRRVSKIRQDWRVEFVCGGRAGKMATTDFQLLRDATERLSCAPGEIGKALDKVLTERDTHFKALRAALEQLAMARAAMLISSTPRGPDGLRIVSILLDEEHPELLLPLATEIAKNERTITLLAHAYTGQIALAQHKSAGKDLQAVLRELFTKFGGKGGGSHDFVRAKLSDPAKASAALELAKHLLQSTPAAT